MQVVDNISADNDKKFLDRLGCGAITKEGKQLLEAIGSDGGRSYGKATKNKELQNKISLRDPKAAGRFLSWVHRVISNVKAVIKVCY